MRNPILQLIVILGLMGAAGTIYNFANAKNPQKHLPWYGGKFYISDPPTVDKPPGPPVDPPTPPKTSAFPLGSTPPTPPAAPSPFRMIQLKDTLEELDGGTTFVDARRTREYEEGHIPGAVSICPYEQVDFFEKVNKLREGAVLEAPIVVYCTNAGECESSKMVAGHLKGAGFVNVLIYHGGFPEWKKEKADRIATGKEPGKWAQ